MNLWKIPNNPATNAKFQSAVCLLALLLLALTQFFDSDHQHAVTGEPEAMRLLKPVNTEARRILKQASKNLTAAPPLRSSAQMEINLFDEQIIAQGQYCQAGRGNRSVRLEFVFGDNENPRSIVQICDQGFFYRVKNGDDKPEVQTMDLRRLANDDKQILFANQSTWMATGGLASLLKNLANNFQFEAVTTDTFEGIPVLVVKGKWQEEYLKRLMFGQVRYDMIKDDIRWKRIRQNIPQQCEIILGNDDYFPLFPYRIAFSRMQQQSDGQSKMQEVVALQLYELQLNADVPAEKFKVNFSGMVKTQLTDAIADRIQNLNEIQRSARRTQIRTNK